MANLANSANLTFNDIKNNNPYVIKGLFKDSANRTYKTIYNGNYYIKSIAPTGQEEIVQVPPNVAIFMDAPEHLVDNLDDGDDKFDDDDDYLETLQQNKYDNFSAFGVVMAHLPDDQKERLYNNFIAIEKQCKKGGRKRKTNKRKTNKRKTKGKKGNKKSSKRRTKR